MAKTEEIDVICAGSKPGETLTLAGAVTRPSDGRKCRTCVILLHGEEGDLHSTHMESTTDSLADTLKTPVFRVTMSSSDLNHRLRAAHGLMHLALVDFGVQHFMLGGQSNDAREPDYKRGVHRAGWNPFSQIQQVPRGGSLQGTPCAPGRHQR